MKDHVLRLSGQTLLYGLGDGGTRVIALLLLPVYAHILSPDQFGEVALATLTINLLSMLLESGQRTAYFRLYYMNEGQAYRRRLTGTVLLYLLAAAVVLLPLSRWVLGTLALPVLDEPRLPPLLDIVLATTLFNIGSVVPFAVFRAEQRAGAYAKLAVGRALLNAILNVVAVVGLRAGAKGILTANLITSAAFCLVCLVLVSRQVEWKVDFRLLRRLLAFGLPHVPANVSGWVLTLSDRLFLQHFGDLSQVGVYAIGYAVASGVKMPMGWFNTAWAPYAMSLSERPDARRVYARLLTYGMTLFAFMAAGAGLFAREAVQILTAPEYISAAKVVALVVGAHLFYELYYLLSLGFDLTFKTWYPALIIVAAGLVNVVLNLALIPKYGMLGAATATILSYMLMPLLVYPIVQRLYPVPYEIGRLLGLGVVTVTVIVAGIALETGTLWIDLPVAVALLGAWVGLLWIGRFFRPSELAAAGSMARDLLGRVRRWAPTRPLRLF